MAHTATEWVENDKVKVLPLVPQPAAEKACALRVQRLTAGYGDSPILKDIDLEVPEGEITILVGPNGCGKSTLLKTMARIITPSHGTVMLNGQNVHQMPTRHVAQQMALLAQGPIAPEGLKVRELVAQGRFPHQSLLKQWTKEDREAVDWAMEVTNIAQFAERPIDALSGGQRQRCWIAMALAQETDLVLLDEPTTFLDLKVQVDVMNLLTQTANEAGKTLVIVLHELNIAAAYADNLVMMRGGEIVAQGAVNSIFTRENLRAVFGLDARVIFDAEAGRPICMPNLNG
ncbi:ABC transporter ATP-binding protein [Maritalea mediterranea]|uniref:ABC transporter ATP-binding protein n=1 Tax=Maritalea mediterranea TaxID=2909667 RepID=A0ABS9E9L7_9HYPH|nr:ABC transporter ATP-binding protein [Maritalea mediterranea]MCF4098146.1 ABC transporter ATP-binding protein [Maritalea mediterranea]